MLISVEPSFLLLVGYCACLAPPQESASADELASAIGPSLDSASASEPGAVVGAPFGMLGVEMASTIAVTTDQLVKLVDVLQGVCGNLPDEDCVGRRVICDGGCCAYEGTTAN